MWGNCLTKTLRHLRFGNMFYKLVLHNLDDVCFEMLLKLHLSLGMYKSYLILETVGIKL